MLSFNFLSALLTGVSVPRPFEVLDMASSGKYYQWSTDNGNLVIKVLVDPCWIYC